MKKAIGLAALLASMGCADFHAQIPFPGRILGPGQSIEIDECGRSFLLKYSTPESGDGEMDDLVELSCYQTFCYVDILKFRVGGTGKFYASGLLFNYNIENDNDGNPKNNKFVFDVRNW